MADREPSLDQIGKQEKIIPENLSFDDLSGLYQKVTELAQLTFRELDNTFKNIKGDAVVIREEKGVFKVVEFSKGFPHAFHNYAFNNKIISNGSIDQEEIMQAIREMILKLDGRIIE